MNQKLRFAFLILGGLLLAATNADASLVASVLPGSRSVMVGVPATAFATLINSGADTATDCMISPDTSVPATFYYQTTDPETNAPVGDPNTPADIAAGGFQTFVIGFTPTEAFAPIDVVLAFECSNRAAAASISGINTLLLSASDTATPDIVALAATPSNDGISKIPNASGTGIFSVATVNTGSGGAIDVSVDTGDASVPVLLFLCQTDPVSGVCINPAVPTAGDVNVSIGADETPTFAIFATGQGDVPLDAALNRAFVRFRDGTGTIRGSTSVALQSVFAQLDVNLVSQTALNLFGGDFTNAALAMFQAYDKGYSTRQVIDGIVGGWLTANGDLVIPGVGTVTPDNPPLDINIPIAVTPLADKRDIVITNKFGTDTLIRLGNSLSRLSDTPEFENHGGVEVLSLLLIFVAGFEADLTKVVSAIVYEWLIFTTNEGLVLYEGPPEQQGVERLPTIHDDCGGGGASAFKTGSTLDGCPFDPQTLPPSPDCLVDAINAQVLCQQGVEVTVHLFGTDSMERITYTDSGMTEINESDFSALSRWRGLVTGLGMQTQNTVFEAFPSPFQISADGTLTLVFNEDASTIESFSLTNSVVATEISGYEHQLTGTSVPLISQDPTLSRYRLTGIPVCASVTAQETAYIVGTITTELLSFTCREDTMLTIDIKPPN